MLKFSDWKYYGPTICSTKLQDSKYYLELSINSYNENIDRKCFITITYNEPLFHNIFQKYYNTNPRDEFDNIAAAMIFINEFIIFLDKHMKLAAFL